MRALLVVVLLQACAPKPACEGDEDPPAVPVATTNAGFLPYGHAHNDYVHDHPLQDALDAKLYSVEADVFLESGVLIVKHDALDTKKGTLQDLYLDPLKAVVDERGDVHGDGVPFTLWLDLKDGSEAATGALASLLGAYGMLTTFQPEGTLFGRVTVVITGDKAGKERMVDAAPPRPFARDANDYAPDDPPADDKWKYYALDWGQYVPWDGHGEAPADADRRLRCIMERAHADGRKVRLWSSPQTENAWRFQLDRGVDFVNIDDLDAWSAFISTYTP